MEIGQYLAFTAESYAKDTDLKVRARGHSCAGLQITDELRGTTPSVYGQGGIL